jgi:hypothetical protein
MNSEFFVKLPIAPVQPDKPVVEVPPPSLDRPAAPIDPAHVQAVDAAFVDYQDKGGPMEALGFYAGMMWLGDIARDILRPLPPLDDPEPKKEPKPGEEEED